jgi:hypothetical protein
MWRNRMAGVLGALSCLLNFLGTFCVMGFLGIVLSVKIRDNIMSVILLICIYEILLFMICNFIVKITRFNSLLYVLRMSFITLAFFVGIYVCYYNLNDGHGGIFLVAAILLWLVSYFPLMYVVYRRSNNIR